MSFTFETLNWPSVSLDTREEKDLKNLSFLVFVVWKLGGTIAVPTGHHHKLSCKHTRAAAGKLTGYLASMSNKRNSKYNATKDNLQPSGRSAMVNWISRLVMKSCHCCGFGQHSSPFFFFFLKRRTHEKVDYIENSIQYLLMTLFPYTHGLMC